MKEDAADKKPRVGVGVIVIRDGKVLLGLRTGSHGAGTWAPPGGHLEYGEEVEACARREVQEETGLTLRATSYGSYVSNVLEPEGKHCVTVFVIGWADAGDPKRVEPDKCSGWYWFDWSAMPRPLFAPLQSLISRGYRPPKTFDDVPSE